VENELMCRFDIFRHDFLKIDIITRVQNNGAANLRQARTRSNQSIPVFSWWKMCKKHCREQNNCPQNVNKQKTKEA